MYYTPQAPIEVEFFEKKSRFICNLCQAASRSEAIDFINFLKEKHPTATHHCSAFIIGNPKSPEEIHYNDDGEPSGTAGKPMHAILEYKNVGNVVAVVTRYFGGVKLGTGGLVRAYSKAVQDALLEVELVPFILKETLHLTFAYHFERQIRNYLEKMNIALLDTKYEASVTFSVILPVNILEECKADLVEFTSGGIVFS